jgi:hypothetical protein
MSKSESKRLTIQRGKCKDLAMKETKLYPETDYMPGKHIINPKDIEKITSINLHIPKQMMPKHLRIKITKNNLSYLGISVDYEVGQCS